MCCSSSTVVATTIFLHSTHFCSNSATVATRERAFASPFPKAERMVPSSKDLFVSLLLFFFWTLSCSTITSTTALSFPSSPHKKKNPSLTRHGNINVQLSPVPRRSTRIYNNIEHIHNLKTTGSTTASSIRRQSFQRILRFIPILFTTSLPGNSANAFEGGVGGLGKTKPETGVEFWDRDAITMGVVSEPDHYVAAELKIQHRPVLVRFQSHWPILSTTAGFETRNIRDPESVFVQVVVRSTTTTADSSNQNALPAQLPATNAEMKEILLQSVLSGKGKFGAYGAPIDIKVKQINNGNSIFRVRFTTYTPGQRETERELLVRCLLPFDAKATDTKNNSLLLLVGGTTQQRFPSYESYFLQSMNSFEAIPTPYTSGR